MKTQKRRISFLVALTLLCAGLTFCTADQKTGGRKAVTAFPGGQTKYCDVNVSPFELSFAGGGGMGTINVAASDGTCTFTAETGETWIGVSPSKVTGKGVIQVYVEPLPTRMFQRAGTVMIGDRIVSIVQSESFPVGISN